MHWRHPMAGKSTISAKDRALILELARQGLGCRSIEARLEGRVKKTAIAEVVAARRREANAATQPAKPGPKTRSPKVSPAPPQATPPSKPAPAAEDASDLRAEAAELLDAADRAHARLDALQDKIHARVDQELALDAPDMRVLPGLTKLVMEVAVALAKTRPPAVLKPEDDPTNVDAAQRLIDRVEKLVSDAERRRAGGAA